MHSLNVYTRCDKKETRLAPLLALWETACTTGLVNRMPNHLANQAMESKDKKKNMTGEIFIFYL